MPEPAVSPVSTDHAQLAWLVLRAQQGDRQALELLLAAALNLLERYVSTLADDESLAADVMQEVLITIYRKLHTLKEPRAFSAWARRIASRAIFRAIRTRRDYDRTHDPLPPDDTLGAYAADPDLMWNDAAPALLEKVSPASRAVLALHYLDGLTLEEIAAVLELPVGTVKSRLAYGLSVLREHVSAADVASQPARTGERAKHR